MTRRHHKRRWPPEWKPNTINVKGGSLAGQEGAELAKYMTFRTDIVWKTIHTPGYVTEHDILWATIRILADRVRELEMKRP